MATSFSIPLHRIEVETEIKKSRFIAWADRADDRDQALAVLTQARQHYPDARHHCWAYLIGAPSQPKTQAMSDDGEPSGTAGKPILNVLQHKQVGNIIIVVSRYFGGIKLGAGGLVRAYSQAAQRSIDALDTSPYIELCQLSLSCDYSLENEIRLWLSRHQATIAEVNYGNLVEIQVSMPCSEVPDWHSFIRGQQIDSKITSL
ncbi:MAG: YigZ family protein [Motiliproteus sp.]